MPDADELARLMAAALAAASTTPAQGQDLRMSAWGEALEQARSEALPPARSHILLPATEKGRRLARTILGLDEK